MGKFLLCFRRPSFLDVRTIGIIDKIKDGEYPASLTLAETLLRLDFVFLNGES